MSRKLIFCLAFAALVSTAWGYNLTFINTNTSNTVSAANDPWWKTTGNDSIPLWRNRGGFGAPESWSGSEIPGGNPDVGTSGEIYQARDSWGDSAGLDWCTLQTTVTGLDAGKTYNMYVFFWMDEAGSPWRVRSALTSAELTSADHLYIGGQTRPGNITQVAHDGANRLMLRAYVGSVSGVMDQIIWVDDEPSDNSNERVWYDGVGYLEVPEPMTIALLGLGGLALRRRKR